MLFLVVLLGFFAFSGYADEAKAACELGKQCKAGSKCVAGVGCVPNGKVCVRPKTPCVWPLRADCKGGCKQRACSSTSSCGTAVNPLNACETSVCRQGFCVAAPLACDDCDSKTGCPGRQHALTVAGAKSLEEREAEQQVNDEGWDHDDDDDDDDHDHHSHHEPEKNQNLIIGFSVFIPVVAAAVVIFLFYLWWTSSSK